MAAKKTYSGPPLALLPSHVPNPALAYPPAPPDKPDDPIGRFLEYDLGAGIKMKYALPALLLLAAAIKGGGRR